MSALLACRSDFASEVGKLKGAEAITGFARLALAPSEERAGNPRPIGDRFFLAGQELDGELGVAGAAQCVDAPLDLRLAGRERGGADEIGSDEAPFSGFTNSRWPRWVSR